MVLAIIVTIHKQRSRSNIYHSLPSAVRSTSINFTPQKSIRRIEATATCSICHVRELAGGHPRRMGGGSWPSAGSELPQLDPWRTGVWMAFSYQQLRAVAKGHGNKFTMPMTHGFWIFLNWHRPISQDPSSYVVCRFPLFFSPLQVQRGGTTCAARLILPRQSNTAARSVRELIGRWPWFKIVGFRHIVSQPCSRDDWWDPAIIAHTCADQTPAIKLVKLVVLYWQLDLQLTFWDVQWLWSFAVGKIFRKFPLRRKIVQNSSC